MSGDSRVSFPKNVGEMIQDIKEIIGKHSDEDIYALLKDCNMDPNETAQKLLYLDTFHEVKRKHERRKVNSSGRSEEYRRTPGMQWQGPRGGRGNYSSYIDDAGGGRNASARKENGVNKCTERGSRPALSILHKTENIATPHVTKSSNVFVNGPASVSDETSSDEPAPQLSAAVAKTSGAVQAVAKTSQVVSGIGRSTNIRSPKKSQPFEERLSESNNSLTVIHNHDTCPPQQLNGPSKVLASEPATVTFSNGHSLAGNDTVLEEATSELDMQLEKLNISPHQPVIFPDHLQVPEAFKDSLTFGSFDVIFDGKGSGYVAEFVQGNSDAVLEPSPSNQSVSSTAQGGDCPDPQPPPRVPENFKPLEDDASSGSVLKYEQSKQEITYPLGGPQFPLLQTTPDNKFGHGPPLMGSHLVQLEGSEPQSGNPITPFISGSTPLATQPAGFTHSTIAVSPQPFPFFQQLYPCNYFPYNPYFPHVYLPPNAHQFLGHNGFPQQPSIDNVYLPPATATGGVKLPLQSSYNPGTNATNPKHFGIQSSFASYISPVLGHCPSAAMTPGRSASTEDLTAPELKEKDIHSTVHQGEDQHVWTCGRDLPSLQAKYFYNLPQGQHIAFLPAQAGHGAFSGIYHPSHTMPSPTVQPLLHSQTTPVSVDSVGPPSGLFQHPHPHPHPLNGQIKWNTALLNRENM